MSMLLWSVLFFMSAGFLYGMLHAYSKKLSLAVTTIIFVVMMIISFVAIISPEVPAGSGSGGATIDSAVRGVASILAGLFGYAGGEVAYESVHE